MKNKFCIISIDGGGLKGLVALRILEIVEDVIGEHIAKRFDLLAGTSTGGLIASALSIHQNNKPLYDLNYIEELYLEVGESVLAKGSYLLSSKDLSKFDNILHNTFKEFFLSEVYKPLFIPTFDIDHQKLVVFKTRAAILNPLKDHHLFDVCRATSAIPPVFAPYPVIHNGKRIHCVDAGVHHLKNPSLAALAEVWKYKKWYGHEDMKEEDIVLLSISTGNYSEGKKHWSTSIKDVFSNQQNGLKYIKEQKLKIDFDRINYLRVDMNLGDHGFSLLQVVEWMNKISDLSTNPVFKKDLRSLLA